MLRLVLPKANPLRILCLGAHSDDIEIGCGCTILRLLSETANTEVYWIVFSGSSVRKKEARASARLFLRGASERTVTVLGYRDGFFPHKSHLIKADFEKLKRRFSPDVIFTHYRNDLHQDHRTICELTWNTFRNHWILEYEIPKYDGDLGAPNFFVPVDARRCENKVEYLLRAFSSQRSKHWFTTDLFRSLLRLRGMESNSPSGFAEAFYCSKVTL